MRIAQIEIKNKINPKYIEVLLIRNAKQYVKVYFHSKTKKYKNERLKKIEDYIKDQYTLSAHLESIILYILDNMRVDENYNLVLDSCSFSGISGEILYKLIVYGTLECQGSAIFREAFMFANLKMRLEMKLKWVSGFMTKQSSKK